MQMCVNYIQIWSNHKSTLGFFQSLRSAVYDVYCFSSKDWFENEDQMANVIIDAEMFTIGNKQMLALKYLSCSF